MIDSKTQEEEEEKEEHKLEHSWGAEKKSFPLQQVRE